MSSSSYRDTLVDEVTAKVIQRSGSVDEHFVRAKAAEAVDELADARIQAFTPLLAENSVIKQLSASRRHNEGQSAP